MKPDEKDQKDEPHGGSPDEKGRPKGPENSPQGDPPSNPPQPPGDVDSPGKGGGG